MPEIAQRIVSLLPAATEILFALGAGDRVVGVTYECTEPPAAAALPKVTDTIVDPHASPAQIDATIAQAIASAVPLYPLDAQLLRSLTPDLLVTQDLCRVCALPGADAQQALETLKIQANLFHYDPTRLDGVLDAIESLGVTIQARNTAQLVDDLRGRLDKIRSASAARNDRRPDVLLLEWIDPPYTAGHWIPDMVQAAGGNPILAHPGSRSSATTWQAIARCNADVLIVAPCGFDETGAQQQLEQLLDRPELAQIPAVRHGRCYPIDADSLIVRPGPRLVDGVEALHRIINR